MDIELTKYNLRVVDTVTFRLVLTSLTEQDVVMFPRSQLNIVQLFTVPFDWEVWTLLVLLLATVEIVHLLLPTIFQNDPILLVVCGFERHDLNQASRWEKFVLHSLMVLMFFITCAYEARFVALMMNKPASRRIETIEQLIASGVKIKADYVGNPGLMRYIDTLGDAMVNGTSFMMKLDKVHGYITARTNAEIVLPYYYDPQQKLFRYSIMDQALGMVIRTFFAAIRCPLLDVFGFTLSTFIESGIYSQWMVLMVLETERFMLERETDETLYFGDLIPAWVVIGIGLVAGVVALICEVVGHRMVTRFSKQRSNRAW